MPEQPGKHVCFAHGKESGPWGSKIRRLAGFAEARGWTVTSPDFSHSQDFDERVDHLLALAPRGAPLVLAGSSMGGYVMAHSCARLKPQGLLLMAPALYLPGFDKEPQDCPPATVVVHGWADDIVPPDTALRFARPRNAELHMLNDGHRLAQSLDILGYLFLGLLDRVEREHRDQSATGCSAKAAAHSATSPGPR